MAVTMSAATSGTYRVDGGSNDAVGLREDLTDIISNISYTQTPFLTSLGRTKATAILHEWQNDVLRAPDANAQPSGFVAAYAEPTPTTRLSNTCQIFAETIMISGTLEAVNKAGRKSELGYQLKKKLKEMARDMELALILEDENTTDTRRLEGLEQVISTNDIDASTADISPAFIDDAMEAVWLVTGESNDFRCLMSSFQKQQVTAFTASTTNTLNINVKEKRLVNSVSIYEGDFGILYCVPHPMLGSAYVNLRGGSNAHTPASEVYLYQPEYCKWAALRPTKVEPMAKVGDAERRMIVAEGTLEITNELACAKITALTTS